jgi:hypothetical protein
LRSDVQSQNKVLQQWLCMLRHVLQHLS